MIVLYTLFALSVFCPIYTYALYPVILRMLRKKRYKNVDIEPDVSVVVLGENATDKIKNIQQGEYPNVEIIKGGYRDANNAKGEIVVFTDTKTDMDLNAIWEIVKPFADERVGAAVGQQINPEGNSAFWKYENIVKRLESRIGCVSGANDSLFAVRKRDLPGVPENVLNKPFYIATKITERGKDIVFQDTAKAYEGKTEGTNFQKHVEDAAEFWQALRLFPKMLVGSHGSFVYVSHRVMKWFVWLNMLVMLMTSGMLAVKGSVVMAILFILQIVVYLMLVLLGRKQMKGAAGRLISIGYYFLTLNVAYFLGLIR